MRTTTPNTTVPFQVAYAVSIHKAQGLEYDSVKIVITDTNEDDITHSIFYTAVTRTRERLGFSGRPRRSRGFYYAFATAPVPKTLPFLPVAEALCRSTDKL